MDATDHSWPSERGYKVNIMKHNWIDHTICRGVVLTKLSKTEKDLVDFYAHQELPKTLSAHVGRLQLLELLFKDLGSQWSGSQRMRKKS